MKRCLYRIILAVVCLGLALCPTVAAQAPDRSRADQLGVVWPSNSAARDHPAPGVAVAFGSELIAEATDPQGDASPPLGWMRWPEPTRSVSAGPDSFRFDLPLFMLHSPQSSFSWTVDSRAATDGAPHDTLNEQGTWQPGGSSAVTDPVDPGVNDYADLTQVSIQTLDPQHLRFELQVRGNTPGAWDSEMYIFSLFPFSTQEWDTWVYLLPSDNPPQTWWSSVMYSPPVAPAPSLPYLDITSSRITRDGGELVIETTVADTVPHDPQTAPAWPMFAWWFNQVPDGGTSGGSGLEDDILFVAVSVEFSWRVSAHQWVDRAWVHFADLQHGIAGDRMTVHVPAGLLPFNTPLLWSTTSGFFLGDDPETYHSQVDWIDGIQLTLAPYGIYLPLIHRNG